MDGVAIASKAVATGQREFSIQGIQAAGDPPLALVSSQHAIEIMTGAVLPQGCDAVVPVEQIRVAAGRATLSGDFKVAAHANVHARGSDCLQGTALLHSGIRLGAPEIAIAAGAGMARIRVSAEPTISVISTGNELIEPGDPIEPHQIRRSNVYGIVAALRRRGFQRIADDHLPDELDALRRRLRVQLDTHDVVILSGGVSMGKFDLVPQALTDLGVRQVFHKVSQRPGKPMWFGVAPSGTVDALSVNECAAEITER
jgi:molybdopterin molybdotransferase